MGPAAHSRRLSDRSRIGTRALRWALLALVAAPIIVVVEHEISRSSNYPVDLALRHPSLGPRTYADALADSSARVAAKAQLQRDFPREWLRDEALADALRDRFRLTGDYADLARASTVMATGRAKVSAPAGPLLADAELAMMGHRLDHAQAVLAAFAPSVAPDPAERAEAIALAGDIAFYRGDMPGAERRYAEARSIDPAGLVLRSAIIAKARGRYDEALADLRASLAERRRPTPFAVATIALQMGGIELARGDHAAARRFFEHADTAFPGYWLTAAHLAQADALDGKPDRAIARMRAVALASGSAEAMDALAMLQRSFGHPNESREWAARASAAWERRLALAPEAAWGHAIEHELVFGSPARALDLARRNVSARPFGESRLLLANALLQAGQTRSALAELRAAEGSGWRSAPLYALRTELLELDGQQAAADEARSAARALNPHIFDPSTALVWFSHG